MQRLPEQTLARIPGHFCRRWATSLFSETFKSSWRLASGREACRKPRAVQNAQLSQKQSGPSRERQTQTPGHSDLPEQALPGLRLLPGCILERAPVREEELVLPRVPTLGFICRS